MTSTSRWRPVIDRAIRSTTAVVDIDDDPAERVWAATILAELDQHSGPAALEALAREPTLDRDFNEDPHTPDLSDRLQAARTLMHFDARRGADALLQLAMDDEHLDDLVQVRAAEILLENADERAGAALGAIAEHGAWHYSRFEAIKLYARIDRHRAARYLHGLIEDWWDLDLESCQDFASLLAQWGDPRHLRLLER